MSILLMRRWGNGMSPSPQRIGRMPMPQISQDPSPPRRAFSLLELLAVIAIMAVLAVAILPALNSTSRSTELGMAAQMVVDEIHYGRSLAAGLNRPVEITFLRDTGSDSTWFEKFRTRTLEQDGTTKWVSQVRRLPETIAISAHPTLSNVLGSQSPQPQTGGGEEVALRFSPSGEMDLVDSSATLTDPTRFLTLAYRTDLQRAPATRPPNFATIQISPRNSQAVVHRP